MGTNYRTLILLATDQMDSESPVSGKQNTRMTFEQEYNKIIYFG